LNFTGSDETQQKEKGFAVHVSIQASSDLAISFRQFQHAINSQVIYLLIASDISLSIFQLTDSIFNGTDNKSNPMIYIDSNSNIFLYNIILVGDIVI
jgi:hypothetical protein